MTTSTQDLAGAFVPDAATAVQVIAAADRIPPHLAERVLAEANLVLEIAAADGLIKSIGAFLAAK